MLFTLKIRHDVLTIALTCDVTGETLLSLFEGAAIGVVTEAQVKGGGWGFVDRLQFHDVPLEEESPPAQREV